MYETIVNSFLVKGGPIMFVLLAMSVVMVAITIAKAIQFNRAKLSDKDSLNTIYNLLTENQTNEAKKLTIKTKNPCSIIVLTVIENNKWEKDRLEDELSRVGELTIRNYSYLLKTLEIIANLSPLLGLLGTIIGMINAFAKVESAASQVDPSL